MAKKSKLCFFKQESPKLTYSIKLNVYRCVVNGSLRYSQYISPNRFLEQRSFFEWLIRSRRGRGRKLVERSGADAL
jgi:hypothetical protein